MSPRSKNTDLQTVVDLMSSKSTVDFLTFFFYDELIKYRNDATAHPVHAATSARWHCCTASPPSTTAAAKVGRGTLTHTHTRARGHLFTCYCYGSFAESHIGGFHKNGARARTRHSGFAFFSLRLFRVFTAAAVCVCVSLSSLAEPVEYRAYLPRCTCSTRRGHTDTRTAPKRTA